METADELIAEHARLILQAAHIETAENAGHKAVKHDGVQYSIKDADELTRAAIFEVEKKMEALGAWS